MTRKVLKHGTWVIVCDGRKAILLQNEGDAAFPNLRLHEVFETEIPASRNLGTAKPGRVFSGKGGRHSAIEPTDLHQQAEDAFLAELAQKIEERVRAGAIKGMILVAPPRALGALRPHLSEGVRSSLLAEVEKDYVRLPIYEIEEHLKDVLREATS